MKIENYSKFKLGEIVEVHSRDSWYTGDKGMVVNIIWDTFTCKYAYDVDLWFCRKIGQVRENMIRRWETFYYEESYE